MSTFKVEFLSALTDEQINQIAPFCVVAWGDDALLQMMVGGKQELKEDVYRAMLRAGALDGDFYVVSDEDGKIVSVALWWGPGKGLFSTPEQRELGFNQILGEIDPITAEWWGKYVHTLDKVFKDSMPGITDPMVDTWYCSLLGTHVDFQRRGFATQLMETFLSGVKGTGAVITIACVSKKVENFYQKFGFKTDGRDSISGPQGSTLSSPLIVMSYVAE